MSDPCRFRYSDKWGIDELTGKIVCWKVKENGILYAEICPDKKIPSVKDTIDIPHFDVSRPKNE